MKSQENLTVKVKASAIISDIKAAVLKLYPEAEWDGSSCSTQIESYTAIISIIDTDNPDYTELLISFIKTIDTRHITTMHTSKLNHLDGSIKSESIYATVNKLNMLPVLGKYSIRWGIPSLYQYTLTLYLNSSIRKENLDSIIRAGKLKADNGYNYLSENY